MFAKLDENNNLIICPRNGISNNVPISNIDIYYANNPDIANADGWYKFVPYDGEMADDTVFSYELEDNKIKEVIK